MIQIVDVNVFQYISQHNSVIRGINVVGKTFTVFINEAIPHSDVTARGLLHYVHQSDAFKALGYTLKDNILGHVTDLRHNVTHVCDDRLKNTSHVHFTLSKEISPALIQLYIDAMHTLENSPDLREQFPEKPWLQYWRDWFEGQGTDTPYDPTTPIQYLHDTDKRALVSAFNTLDEQGFLTIANQACPIEHDLSMFVQPPLFTHCRTNDFLQPLPALAPTNNTIPATTDPTIHAAALVGTVLLSSCCLAWMMKKPNNPPAKNRPKQD